MDDDVIEINLTNTPMKPTLSSQDEENAIFLSIRLVIVIADALKACGFEEENAKMYADAIIEASYDADIMPDLAQEFTAIRNSKKD